MNVTLIGIAWLVLVKICFYFCVKKAFTIILWKQVSQAKKISLNKFGFPQKKEKRFYLHVCKTFFSLKSSQKVFGNAFIFFCLI